MLWAATLTAVIVAVSYGANDDDLEFLPDVAPSVPSVAVPVRRLWGIPDYQAVVGKLFTARIPDDAFSGDIDFYEGVKSRNWPPWLEISRNGLLKGVPGSDDVGVQFLVVRAVGPHAQHNSKDAFAVEVIKPGLDTFLPGSSKKDQCPLGVDPLILSVLMDKEISDIEYKQRVAIIESVAGYFGLPQEIFYLRELTTPRDILSLADTTVIMAGVGNVKNAKDKDFASLSFQIGCGRDIHKVMRPAVERLRGDASDGTLAEVLQQPVVGWHARNELPVFFRERREVGSGDFYEEEDDAEDYGESLTTLPTPHPHRHHHGEEQDLNRLETFAGPDEEILQPSEVSYQRPSQSLLVNYDNIISTPPFVPERPTVIAESTSTLLPTRVTEIDLTPSSVSPNLVSSEGDHETHQPMTVPHTPTSGGNITELTSESSSDLSSASQPMSSSSSSSPNTSHRYFDTTPELPSTDSMSVTMNHTWTTIGTTEEIEPETRNFPPTIAHRLKKVAVVAGKLLRFKIPENTFIDVEDGTMSHMTISFKTMEGKPIPPTSWIMFNSTTREIIALPLEEHVSKWEFLVEARDKDGDNVSDTFELQVQQHKGTRTVNHEFTLTLSVLREQGFNRALDWELKTLSALTKVYGDKDSSHITVRAVSHSGDPVSFTWTNDSLPRSYCPREDIDRLLKVISLSDDGFPSSELQEALGSTIKARRISYQGIENCETKVLTLPPPDAPSINYAPVPRNQIDQINATVGKLLLYRVPEDTFYDPEDGGTRKLRMSLLDVDRSPLAPDHWLQFDAKNQEFYGVPMDKDVRSQEYQLVCEDRAGLSANDGLIVFVRPPIQRRYNVEFSIALDIAFEEFSNSASLKRKFIEKLQEVFGDPNTDSVVIGRIISGSTVITWFNQSLPTDYCPEEEIRRLRSVLINDNDVMTERLINILGSEFSIISVGLEPAGACQGELTVLHRPESPAPPIDESHPMGNNEDYLLTFVIPAIVIASMLILASLIACLFYRKRRAGKMGIGDEAERQSFRNKGIPVIFQDELEDKPEPENKNPVIMKEEKPPLPPPEYQRGQEMAAVDTPYHPPPPFTASRESGRNTRPKPTPTYRKPPPYVPP